MHVCFSGHAVSGRVASDGHELRRRVRHHQQQLIATRSSTDEPTHYHYWPDGTRAAVLHPDHTATYTFGSIEATRDLATNTWVTATRLYSHAATTVAARTNNQPLDWLLGDRQGSITTTITAGAATTRYYHPYGQPRGDVPTDPPTDRSWLNQTQDHTGLTYLNHRYHDQRLGLFTSVDPLLTTTWQPYTYANANPTTLSDPTGLCAGLHHDAETCSEGAARRRRGRGEGASATIAPATYFDPQPGLGVVRTNLFISECQVGEPFATSDGNCRGFSSTAGCSDSKVCITVNFEQGWVSGRISPTCHGNSCTDAYPLDRGNTLDVRVDGSGGELSISVHIDALNPRAPTLPWIGAPAIDANIVIGVQTVSRPGSPSLHLDSFDETVMFIRATGDDYPSLESYIEAGTSTITAIRDGEGPQLPPIGPFPLIPMWPHDRNIYYERTL